MSFNEGEKELQVQRVSGGGMCFTIHGEAYPSTKKTATINLDFAQLRQLRRDIDARLIKFALEGE